MAADAINTGIVLNLDSSVNPSIANYALAQWSTCTGSLPSLSTSGTSPFTFQVKIENQNAPAGFLAQTDTNLKVITLFSRDYEGRGINTQDQQYILTHELGHVLGLAEAADSDCLMGPAGRSGGRIKEKKVASTDCSYLVSMWAYICHPKYFPFF